MYRGCCHLPSEWFPIDQVQNLAFQQGALCCVGNSAACCRPLQQPPTLVAFMVECMQYDSRAIGSSRLVMWHTQSKKTS